MAGKHASIQAEDQVSEPQPQPQPQQPVTVESEIRSILDARRARRA